MQYLKQFTLILTFTFLGEAVSDIFNLSFPGSIIGMLLLFSALKLKWIRLETIRDAGNYLLGILPVLFVPLGVGIIAYVDVIRDQALVLTGLLVATTLLVMAVSGWTVQAVKALEGGKRHV